MSEKTAYIKTYKRNVSTTTYTRNNRSAYFGGNYDRIVASGFFGQYIFAAPGDLVLECWVRLHSVNRYHMLITKAISNGATIDEYELRVEPDNTVKLKFNNGSINYNTFKSNFTISIFTWTHIAVKRDHTTKQVKFFKNGVPETPSGTYTGNIPTDTVADLMLGQRPDLNSSLGLIGYMCEVRVWTELRTDQEIADNYNKILVGNEPGLGAYFKLDEYHSTISGNYINSAFSVHGTGTGMSSGTTQPTLTDTVVSSFEDIFKGVDIDYKFDAIQSNILGGFGDVSFTLPATFDDYGRNEKVGLNGYINKVIIYDKESPEGSTVFQGEIVKIKSNLNSSENVNIVSVGPVFRLEKTPLRTELENYSITYTGYQLEDIIKDILDKYNAIQFGAQISYSSDSIQNTSRSTTMTFNNATCLDAIKAVFRMVQTDWIWFIDVDYTFYLKPISSTPDHYFSMNKDVVSIEIDENKLDIVNKFAFWNGSSARRYSDQTSIDEYGEMFEKRRDDRFSTTGMDQYGQKLISDSKDPNSEVKIKVLDSSYGGYDLESIKVGDTCKVLNVGESTALTDNMIITQKIDYLDYVELTISDAKTYVSRELYNLKKSQEIVNYSSGPSSYTVVS